MPLLAVLLAAALSRAELVERFRAAPAVMCDGLVQVRAACPAAIRREYQLPVGGFFTEVCRALYASRNVRPRRFENPGLVVVIGDVTTNDATVVTRVASRSDGTEYLRVLVPAPGYADAGKLRLAAVRGWSLAVTGKDPGEAGAEELLADAFPETRVAAEVADIAAWREEGVYRRGRDDEDYLALRRKVLRPGFATREEILTFSARLVLLPAYADAPFRGKYRELEFREALYLAKDDLLVRLAALRKADELLVWGGGRGERLSAAAAAYSDFLRALARGDTELKELDRMLSAAEDKLKETLE